MEYASERAYSIPDAVVLPDRLVARTQKESVNGPSRPYRTLGRMMDEFNVRLHDKTVVGVVHWNGGKEGSGVHVMAVAVAVAVAVVSF